MPTLPIRTATLSVQLPVPLLASNRSASLLSTVPEARLEHTDGKRTDGPQGIAERHGRMTARTTEATETAMAALPQYQATGRRPFAADPAREAAFAALSSELRLCLDGHGRVTYAAGAWQATLGLEPGALVGEHWTSLVAMIDHAPMRGAIERVVSLGDVRRELTLRMNADDDQPFVHWSLMPGAQAEEIM